MKTIQEIAQYINERRLRAMPVVMPGEVVNEIGSEGMQECLDRRWLVPDHDSGFLQVTTESARLKEVEAVAQTDPKAEGRSEPASHQFVLDHAERSRVDEIAAPATGGAPPALVSATDQPPPTAGAPVPGDIQRDLKPGKKYKTTVVKDPNAPAGTGMKLEFGPEIA